MGGGGGGNADDDKKHNLELERVKRLASEGGGKSLTKYQSDLLKWSKNVDAGYAWVILATSFLMLNATLLPTRIYGLVYAKVLEIGEYNREEASWPSSMLFCCENLVGPIISVLAFYLPAKTSYIVGQLLLGLGHVLAYYSNSLLLDVLFLGVMQGVGISFILTPFWSVINQYFIKYRNVALGLALSGGTMSVYFFGPLFRYLLDEYPYRTTYLGLGIVCLCSIVSTPLIKPNPKPKNLSIESKEPLNRVSSLNALKAGSSFRSGSAIAFERIPSGTSHRASVVSVNPFDTVTSLSRSFYGRKAAAIRNSAANTVSMRETANDRCKTVGLDEIGQDQKFKLSIIMEILGNVAFHLIWYIETVYYWVFSIFTLVVIDMAVDKGIDRDDAKFLINYWSAGELIGRLVLTALVDLKYLSNRCVVIVTLLLMSVSLGVTIVTANYYVMALLVGSISSLGSLLFIMINGLLVDCLGEEQVTSGFGMASFLVGTMVTARTKAVGYCRDQLGTYSPLLFGMSLACLLGALMWAVESVFHSRRTRKEQASFCDNSELEA